MFFVSLCLAGSEDIVRILLSHNADVNLKSSKGFTALYMAAQGNHLSIVKLLLDHNADPTIAAQVYILLTLVKNL